MMTTNTTFNVEEDSTKKVLETEKSAADPTKSKAGVRDTWEIAPSEDK